MHLEIERYEQALSNFRINANYTRKDGLAETEERALKLGENEKTRDMFQKGLLSTITYVDGKKLRDRGKVYFWTFVMWSGYIQCRQPKSCKS